jgi:hypothetical protein
MPFKSIRQKFDERRAYHEQEDLQDHRSRTTDTTTNGLFESTSQIELGRDNVSTSKLLVITHHLAVSPH